jgi:hypothetical protein
MAENENKEQEYELETTKMVSRSSMTPQKQIETRVIQLTPPKLRSAMRKFLSTAQMFNTGFEKFAGRTTTKDGQKSS